MRAAALALAIALTDGPGWRELGRGRLIAAAAPLAIVLSLSVLWRLT